MGRLGRAEGVEDMWDEENIQRVGEGEMCDKWGEGNVGEGKDVGKDFRQVGGGEMREERGGGVKFERRIRKGEAGV
jgi:hypothetical protein